MKKIIIFIIIYFSPIIAQQNNNRIINIYSPANIKKFADYLYCQQDYLRAIEQYNRFLLNNNNDTVEFKIGLAYLRMGDYVNAADQFYSFNKGSTFLSLAYLEYYRAIFEAKDYTGFRKFYNNAELQPGVKYYYNLSKLNNFTYFFTDEQLPGKSLFLLPFDKSEKKSVNNFYERKVNPSYKNPVLGAVLSAVIPGLGKIYAEQYSDGITAAIATGILTYLSIADFNAGHTFRGWLFTGLAAGFYGGNIYGSYAAVQIFNAKIDFDFTRDVNAFLKSKNFFTPVINFCK